MLVATVDEPLTWRRVAAALDALALAPHVFYLSNVADWLTHPGRQRLLAGLRGLPGLRDAWVVTTSGGELSALGLGSFGEPAVARAEVFVQAGGEHARALASARALQA